MLSMMIVSCKVNAQEVDARDNYPYPIETPAYLFFAIEDVSTLHYDSYSDKYIVTYEGFNDWENYNFLNHTEEEPTDFIQFEIDKETFIQLLNDVEKVKINYADCFELDETYEFLEYYDVNSGHFYYTLKKLIEA